MDATLLYPPEPGAFQLKHHIGRPGQIEVGMAQVETNAGKHLPFSSKAEHQMAVLFFRRDQLLAGKQKDRFWIAFAKGLQPLYCACQFRRQHGGVAQSAIDHNMSFILKFVFQVVDLTIKYLGKLQ